MINAGQFIHSLAQLLRPINLLITAVVVVAGGYIASKPNFILSTQILLAALSAASVAAGANAVNDACDAAVDRINKPERPIPSGRISPKAAYLIGIVLSLLGVIIGFFIGRHLGWIALGVAVLLTAYNLHLKHLPLIGNAAVAACGGAAFIYGSTAVGRLTGALLPALFAFLIHTGREIVKDVEDIAGDSERGARTIAIIWGEARAGRMAGGILAALVIITLLAYFILDFSKLYLYFLIPLITVPLIFLSVLLWFGVSRRQIASVSVALKVVMIAGIFVLIVA